MYGLSEAMDKAFDDYYTSTLHKEQAYKKIKMVADAKSTTTILTKEEFMAIAPELKGNYLLSEKFGLETLGSIHCVVDNSTFLIESDEFGQAIVSYTGDI